MEKLLIKKISLFFGILFILLLMVFSKIFLDRQSDETYRGLEALIKQVEFTYNQGKQNIEDTNSIAAVVIDMPTKGNKIIFAVDKNSGDLLGVSRDNEPIVELEHADTKKEYLALLNSCTNGKIVKINGTKSYVKTKNIENTIIGAYVEMNTVYNTVLLEILYLSLASLIILFCVLMVVRYHIKRYMLKDLYFIERNIKELMVGNYNVTFETNYDTELRQISEIMNDWKDSYKNRTERLTRIISNIDSNVAVFECLYPINRNFFSYNMQNILGIADVEWSKIKRTPKQFEEYAKKMISLAEGEEKIIEINNKYLNIVTFNEEGEFYGMIIDRTEDIEMKNRIRQELHDVQIESETDPLTKVTNRAGVEKHIRKIFENENPNGLMLMFDLDNFKTINDELGHPEGDKVLKKFANCLKSQFRSDDVIGRIGGDEFVVFIAEKLSVPVISKKLESLLQNIRKELSDYTKRYELSTSIGVAYIDNLINSYEDLYKCADVALYMAKRAGKDRFHINEDNIFCMKNQCTNCRKDCKRKKLLRL